MGQFGHAVVIELLVIVGGFRGVDGSALLIDGAIGLHFRRVRLVISDPNAAFGRGDGRFHLADLRFRFFDGKVDVRAVEHHEDIAFFDAVAFFHRFAEEPTADGIERRFHLLGGQNAVFSFTAEHEGVVSRIKESGGAEQKKQDEHRADADRFLREVQRTGFLQPRGSIRRILKRVFHKYSYDFKKSRPHSLSGMRRRHKKALPPRILLSDSGSGRATDRV